MTQNFKVLLMVPWGPSWVFQEVFASVSSNAEMTVKQLLKFGITRKNGGGDLWQESYYIDIPQIMFHLLKSLILEKQRIG